MTLRLINMALNIIINMINSKQINVAHLIFLSFVGPFDPIGSFGRYINNNLGGDAIYVVTVY